MVVCYFCHKEVGAFFISPIADYKYAASCLSCLLKIHHDSIMREIKHEEAEQ